MLVTWDRDGHLYARFASGRGKLGATQALGRLSAPTSLQADLSGDGRAVVGWTSQAVSEGDAASPFTATVSLLRRAGVSTGRACWEGSRSPAPAAASPVRAWP